MTKKFSEVARLYQGCEVVLKKSYVEELNDGEEIFEEPLTGHEVWTLEAVGDVDYEGECFDVKLKCGNKLLYTHKSTFTPRLYSPADITEEQAKELVRIKYNCLDVEDIDILKHNNINSGFGYKYPKNGLIVPICGNIFFDKLTPEQLLYLLEQKVWLFGDEAFEKREIVKLTPPAQ